MKINNLHSFFGVLLLSSSSLAQDLQIETITVTATRQSASLMDISSNLGLLDELTLSQTQQEHINQVMVRIPGVWISRGNGQEHLTAIRSPVLTGAGGCGAFYMAQDGIALRAPGFCNANQLFDTNSEQAQQIEVLRGPGSTLYGTNAVHGVINVLTPDPLDAVPGYVSLEAGPHDYLRNKFQYNTQSDGHGFLIQGNLSHDGGYKEESGADQQKLTVIHQFDDSDISIKNVLSVTNLNQETAGFIQGFEAYKDPLLKSSNPNPEAFRDSRSARLYSIINYQLDEQSELKLVPYLRWADMAFLQHFLPWKALEENDQRSAGIQGQYSLSFNDWSFLAGMDIDHSIGNLRETQAEPFSGTIPQGEHYDYQVKNTVLSPFVRLDWQVSSRFSLNLGSRYERNRFSYDNYLSNGSACAPEVQGCRFSRPQDQNKTYNNWSYQLGGQYKLTDNQRIYAQFSSGFRAPQATELFRLQAGQTVTELEAEQMRSIELGARGQWQSLFVDIALFSMDKEHFIFQDTQRQNISDGETEHYGMEVSIHKQITDQTYMKFNGTLAKHRYKNNITITRGNILGNEIDTAPEHIASAHLGWKSADGHSLEAEFIHQGNYYLDPANSAEYAGHNLFNLRGSYQLSEDWMVSARVINLLDRDYAERADFGFGNYRYFVGEPRSLYLGIRTRL